MLPQQLLYTSSKEQLANLMEIPHNLHKSNTPQIQQHYIAGLGLEASKNMSNFKHVSSWDLCIVLFWVKYQKDNYSV